MALYKATCECGHQSYGGTESEAQADKDAHEAAYPDHNISSVRQVKWKVVCNICGGKTVSSGHDDQQDAQASASAHYQEVGQTHGPDVVEE